MAYTYFEIAGRRRYEFRTYEDNHFTGWQEAGQPNAETLARIAEGLQGVEYWEVRQVTDLADEAGTYAGRLIFAELVAKSSEE